PFLRHFFLCESNSKSFRLLKDCADEYSGEKARTVELFRADFNNAVDKILISPFITENEATFCLLDQRMFECQWNTVRKIARKKKKMKIEIFYFYGFGWVKRALAGVTRNQEVVRQWWGRDDYQSLKDRTREEIGKLLIQRF